MPKYYRKKTRKVSRRSRTRVRSSYIRKRKATKLSKSFKRKVEKALPHKIIYGSTPGAYPNNDTITPAGTVGSIFIVDSMLAVAQGPQISERLGNRISVMFQKFKFQFQGYTTPVMLIPTPPVAYACVHCYELWAVKGQYINLLANIDAFFFTGGAIIPDNVIGYQTDPSTYDPAQLGFWCKRYKKIHLPEYDGVNNVPMLMTSNFKVTKFNGTRGNMMYQNNAANSPLTERPVFLFMNGYDNTVSIFYSAKAVFVDATK